MKRRHVVAVYAGLVAYVGGGVWLGFMRYHAVLAAANVKTSGMSCSGNLSDCRFIPQIHQHVHWISGFCLPMIGYMIGVPILAAIALFIVFEQREKDREKALQKAAQCEPA